MEKLTFTGRQLAEMSYCCKPKPRVVFDYALIKNQSVVARRNALRRAVGEVVNSIHAGSDCAWVVTSPELALPLVADCEMVERLLDEEAELRKAGLWQWEDKVEYFGESNAYPKYSLYQHRIHATNRLYIGVKNNLVLQMVIERFVPSVSIEGLALEGQLLGFSPQRG